MKINASNTKRDITGITPAVRYSPAASAEGQWCRQAPGATIGITACLTSLHVDNEPGDRQSECGGIMDAIALWVRNNGECAVIHRCRRCGALSSNRTAADDNPMKIMSIALKPLCEPPFPVERIEELTRLMGGEGSLK